MSMCAWGLSLTMANKGCERIAAEVSLASARVSFGRIISNTEEALLAAISQFIYESRMARGIGKRSSDLQSLFPTNSP
jgi:hypothetical protein